MNIKNILKQVVFSTCFLTLIFNNSAFAIIAAEPTIQTFSFTANQGSCNEIDLTFIPGDGSRRIIIGRPDAPVSKLPEDGKGYSSGSLFGSGSNLGDSNYVVYNTSGTSTTITGLDGGREYFFAIFEFNGSGSNSNYLLPGYLEANAIVLGFTMSVSSTSGDMCKGDSVRLEVQGADSYEWTPSNSLSSNSGTQVWATPNSTTQYQVTGSDNSGCIDSKTITITVYSPPTVTLGNFSNLCENNARISINSGSPTGGTYSGDGVSGTHFYPDVAGVGRHILTYTYSDIHGCSAEDTSSILVSAAPNVHLSSLDDVCINAPSFTLTGGTPTGGIYSGDGVASGIFYPIVAGVGQNEITYIYTNGAGCSDTDKTNQRVRDIPNVNFSTLQPVCLNLPAFNLTAGSPVGGVYSGTGVSNSQFSPLVSGAGTFILTYSFTDNNGCSSQDTSTIKVHTLPSVGLSTFTPVCQNYGPVTLSGGTPIGGTYTGTGVGNGIFYSGIAGPGDHTIVYTYTNANNCSNTATQIFTVHPAPKPNLGNDTLVCSNASIQLSAGTFSSYAWSTGSHSQKITVDTTSRGLGTFSFSIIVTNNFGCANKDTIRVTFDQCNGINDLPHADDDISVYPNPSSSKFTLQTKVGSEVFVYDIKGTLILENKNTPEIFMFGENLSPGTYLIRVKNKSANSYKLILKN